MTKGKNFSCNNIDGKRRKADFYETPYSLTALLVDNINNIDEYKYNRSILEPACGDGSIVKVLKAKDFINVTSYDVEKDFFTEDRKFDVIITNPPYSKAFEFIKKAADVVNYEAYFLLPLSYLHGKKRYDEIYRNGEFSLQLYNVSVFTRYPLLGEPLREDGKHNTGMMVYAWFCFKQKYYGYPTISWLDNDPYILGKDDKNNA